MADVNSRENATSLERIVPEELELGEATGGETLKVHLDRYEFAKRNLLPGRILDLACGVGYGTILLAERPGVSSVTGVDISQDAVKYAIEHYRCERVNYICSPALEFNPQEKFDSIVSLETIEHVDDPNRLFAHLISLLKPGGRLIASVPVTPSVDANPHHKTNFSAKSFRRVGDDRSLEYIDSLLQVQRFNPFSIASRRERRTADLRTGIMSFYLHHPSHIALRVWSILRDGFANKYLTVVWEKRRR